MLFPHYQIPPLYTDEAAPHREMAIRALRGNESVFVRLARYNSHMASARQSAAKSASGQHLEIPECSIHSSSPSFGRRLDALPSNLNKSSGTSDTTQQLRASAPDS
jgi:hypothetical protein